MLAVGDADVAVFCVLNSQLIRLQSACITNADAAALPAAFQQSPVLLLMMSPCCKSTQVVRDNK
jgi:hypothetical protein